MFCTLNHSDCPDESFKKSSPECCRGCERWVRRGGLGGGRDSAVAHRGKFTGDTGQMPVELAVALERQQMENNPPGRATGNFHLGLEAHGSFPLSNSGKEGRSFKKTVAGGARATVHQCPCAEPGAAVAAVGLERLPKVTSAM